MIGTRIKEIRKERKVTQSEFSEKVCVTQSYISRVEAGKEVPTEMLIKLIALEFNVSLNWLKTGEGSMELSDNEHDYFERKYASTYRKSVPNSLKRLSDILSDKSNPVIDVDIEGIISHIELLLSMYKDNENFCALILEQLANIIVSFYDTISSIEENDISSPSYLNVIYGHLRYATKDINDIFMQIGSAYEERIK